MRGLLGTPGAGLEMSWCIQKPPDAAQEDNGGSRQLGPGVARERRANPKYPVPTEGSKSEADRPH
jgi:hypothetical protein